jgi:hypothetical protein
MKLKFLLYMETLQEKVETLTKLFAALEIPSEI